MRDRESFLREEPFENELGGEWVTRWHSRQRKRPVWRPVWLGGKMPGWGWRSAVHVTVDFVSSCRDFGPNPASHRVGGAAACSHWHWCFAGFWLHC